MSAQPVDVLAVLDRCAGKVEAFTARTVYRGAVEGFVSEGDDHGLREARAAVAELIEASRPVANTHLHEWGNGRFLYPVEEQHIARLRAALARCGGAKP